MPPLYRNIVLGIVGLAMAWVAYDWAAGSRPPTMAAYVAAKPGRLIAPADFAIDGVPSACARAGVVIDPFLDDVAAAFPGFIILNPKGLVRVPKVVRLYAFGHECGHHLKGVSEEMADCYAVMRGEAQGWLDAKGVEEICAFWKPMAADTGHAPGPARCDLMRRCFQSAARGKG